MKTSLLFTTLLYGVAACGGDSGSRMLEIEPLKIAIDVPSSPHDVDLIHAGESELFDVDAGSNAGSAAAKGSAASTGSGSAAAGSAASPTGALSRVDITVPKLRMCRISIFPKGEEMTFEKRVETAAIALFGTERALTQWHRKEKTADGWILDYEVTENGKPMRVITQRKIVDGRTFTCESGRIAVDEQAARCAEVVAHACTSLTKNAG